MTRFRHRSFFCPLILLLTVFGGSVLQSQSINAAWATRRWHAAWIRCPGGSAREFGVFHFRKTFMLPSAPGRFVVHTSGDNRYELYVNGRRAATGPARGDLKHWRYETLDIAPYLGSGRNVIAAIVWNYAEDAPMAQMTNEAGFVLQGDTAAEVGVNTDASWKAFNDGSIEAIHYDSRNMGEYFVVGPGERLRASRYPWGWEQLQFDDSSWKTPLLIGPGSPRDIRAASKVSETGSIASLMNCSTMAAPHVPC